MSQRNILVVLFVSLAVNLFLLGAGAGALLLGDRLHGPPRGGPRPGGQPLMAAAESLPPDQADAFREAVRDQVQAVAPKMRQARELRRAALARLGSQPLDIAPILKDLDQSRAMQTEAQDEVDHAIVQFASHLPPDQRTRLGEALARPPHRQGQPPMPSPPPQP